MMQGMARPARQRVAIDVRKPPSGFLHRSSGLVEEQRTFFRTADGDARVSIDLRGIQKVYMRVITRFIVYS